MAELARFRSSLFQKSLQEEKTTEIESNECFVLKFASFDSRINPPFQDKRRESGSLLLCEILHFGG